METMEKLDIYFRSFLVLFIAGFLGLIVYVSLLGDNHKINFVVEQYFTQVKNRDFSKLCDLKNSTDFLKTEACRDQNFLLETAFLVKYDLLSATDYAVEIQRSHFRIPFFTDDCVSISVALTPVQDNFIKAFFGSKEYVYVNDFILVEKKSKLWEITDISMKDPSLLKIYNNLQKDLDLNRYVSRTEKGYVVNRVDINPESLSRLERRLFEYSMGKLSDL